VSEALRVLVVEDEAILSMQLELLIEDAGHVVVGTAFSAAEAIRMARETQPDVAFVDLQLRGGSSGLDVARAVRDLEGTTVVFVTANAAMLPEDFEGGAAVIPKPFTVAIIEGTLPYLEECLRRPPPKTTLPTGMRLAPAYETRWAAASPS
jgi:CheY-like chemotaxis protein